jgi:hypothetical protein
MLLTIVRYASAAIEHPLTDSRGTVVLLVIDYFSKAAKAIKLVTIATKRGCSLRR